MSLLVGNVKAIVLVIILSMILIVNVRSKCARAGGFFSRRPSNIATQ